MAEILNSTLVRSFQWVLGKETNIIHEGICFVPIKLSAVKNCREYVKNSFHNLNISDEKILLATVAISELVTNAIFASLEKQVQEDVAIRWSFRNAELHISVIDYAGGIDLISVQKKLPHGESFDEFIEEVKSYSENSNFFVTEDGEQTLVQRFGRGLRIVRGIADSFMIEYHNREHMRSKRIDAFTRGSIFSITIKMDS